MHLTRLAVRDWRGLAELELADLDPGLNLVLGENESGKSRLVQALWYGLFESSKGKAAHKLGLASWGGQGAPWVEVGFVASGTGYRVEKTFGQAACATRLRGPDGAWDGEEAEQRLAQLLRVGSPGGGRPTRAEELGVWPLLWVHQFRSGSPPDRDLNDESRARLQDVLADAVGEVAAGPAGHGLLERARAERALYYTERGQERAPLKEAADAAAAAEEALAEASRAHREFEQAVGELEDLQQALARHRQDQQRTSSKLARAREVANEAGLLNEALQAERGKGRVLEEQVAGARREVQLWRERQQSLERARGELDRLDREQVAVLEAREGEQSGALRTAEGELRATESELRLAGSTLRRARHELRRREAQRRRQELQRRFDRATAAAARVEEVARAIAGLRVDAARVAKLRDLQRQLETARARALGVATRVCLRARAPLVVDGAALAEGAERTWSCSAPVQIEIAGVGELEVVPGGEDLGRLRVAVEQLEERCDEHREAMGVESLEAAEALLADRERLQQDWAGAERLMAELCPEGLAPLGEALAEAVAARRALGEDDPEAPDEAAAEERHQQLEAGSVQLRGEVEARRRSLAELQAGLAAARARAEGLREVVAELAAQVGDVAVPERLAGHAAETEAAWQKSLATVTGLAARLDELGGAEAVHGAVERLQQALEGLQGDAERMHRRRAELNTTLEILAKQNLHEAEQQAAAQLAAAEQARQTVTRRARAAHTLAETLEACRAESQARLLAPAVAAVGKHLRPLFPAARVALSGDLTVAGLESAAGSEPLADLSGGTREQVGIAVRLGLAELLAAGERLPLVFDDALTNTDFSRIEQLHQILYAAAADLQILVFSCHPEAFAALGAGRRYRLAGSRPR